MVAVTIIPLTVPPGLHKGLLPNSCNPDNYNAGFKRPVSFASGHDSPVQVLLVRAIQGNGKRFPRTAFCHSESTNSN
jgi:hypothetical protein